MLAKSVQKIKRNLSDYGIRVTLVKTFERLFSPIYRSKVYRIYRINLSTAPKVPDSDDHTFTLRLLEVNDRHFIDQIEDYAEFLHGDITKMIQNDGFCYIAILGGQLAGFNLISFGEIFMTLVRVQRIFQPEEAWSEHIAVLPDFRRKGLASLLRYHVFEELRSRQFKRLYGGALVSNSASLKLAQRVGFRSFVDIEYQGILWWDFWQYRRVKDDTH